ncbi:OmpA family protein [Ekhidna lutea]|uniref:OmpA family protein n=1 Tax=Ekhidna lutea TaxID=447679 RepID=A0A239H3J4_EKHLU|nr:OmpA family protein [Ekhidna lutea]SNS75940.1 OmpA family protein [Ekhidna lutea]
MRTLIFTLLAFSALVTKSQDQPEAYILKSIYFGGGSYYVDEYQFEELQQLVDSVKDIRDYTITIHSHTDNIGGAAYNEWLSEMRGDAVIQKLLNLEFKSNQIEKRDFGQFNPVYDNNTWEGRRKNRRVDIIFWPVVM